MSLAALQDKKNKSFLKSQVIPAEIIVCCCHRLCHGERKVDVSFSECQRKLADMIMFFQARMWF